METLYELKEMLCDELEQYGKKGELTAGALDVVDKLTHTIKNLDKIIDKYEEDEYSGAYAMNDSYEGSYRRGGNSVRSNRSYARGRGSNARRDSMGRYASENGYSRHGDMIEELYELMESAPNEQTKREFQKLISKMETM